LLNEKIRMLVLSALYKAESLLSLGDTPPNVIHDLLAKCDAYVDKYSMHDDKDITESIRSKKKSLLHYQTVKNSGVNSYEQLEEVRPSPVSTSGTKQISPRTTYYTAGSSSQVQSKIQPRDSSTFKKGFVLKSKRGLSTEARVSDHSHGSTSRTAGPLDSYKPSRKSPTPVAIRRVSRDISNTPNSRLSHDHKDRDHFYARKRMAPRLTHDPRYDDLELSYATMRQSHGAEGGKGNFFKPKLKNQPSRIDTDGSEPIAVQKEFLEDSERYEPEPEPETEKPGTVGSPSMATKSTRPKSAAKIQSSRAKKGFKEGLDGLLKLGDYLKSQIEKEMEEDERRKRKKALGQKIFEDSFSGPEKSSIDKEINSKMNDLLSSVAEWEKQRIVFQERFQKLEKALETKTVLPIQTNTSEERQQHHPNQQALPPKQGPYGNRPADDGSANLFPRLNLKPNLDGYKSQEASVSRKSFKPEPAEELGQRNSIQGGTTPMSADRYSRSRQTDTLSPQGIPILSKNASAARSLMSLQSAQHTYRVSELEDFTESIEVCLQQLEAGEVGETEVLHNLDQHYLIIFQVRNTLDPKSKTIKGSVALKLLKDSELLGEEILTSEDLRYLFQQVNLVDTFSHHIPVTSFSDITYFLQYCLVKFVHLSDGTEGNLQPEVLKFPKSLIDEVIWTNFLGEDCTATLIHLYGSTFRLIVRAPPTPEGDTHQGHSIDVIFNEFVLNNFFEAHQSEDPSELVEKVSQGISLTEVERSKLKRFITMQHSCLLFSQDSAKLVWIYRSPRQR
jgi:hypothetical protein